MEFSYKTKGVCSSSIIIDVEDGIVMDVKLVGGCNGNLKGIASLVEGMSVSEVAERLSGIKCGFKRTSCPDQLAKAVTEAYNG